MSKVFSFGVVTSRGIYINNLFYTCSIAIERQWFFRASNSGPWIVPVIYDTEKTDFIRLYHNGKFHEANLIPGKKLTSNREVYHYFDQLNTLRSEFKALKKYSRKNNGNREEGSM